MRKSDWPGLATPARLLLAALALASSVAGAAQQPAAPVAATTAPDSRTVLKLVWSTMAAVHHANVTGNYSVLRDLGTASFQANNNAAALAAIFASVREQRVDLAETLTLTPVYDFEPAMLPSGMLRIRGRFPMRPAAIGFDLIFQRDRDWRLHGISIAPLAAEPIRRAN